MTHAGSWDPEPLSVELEGIDPDDLVDWALDRLDDGVTPEELCTAAMSAGLRRTRPEGRGPHGSVSSSVIAAKAMIDVGRRQPTLAALAAVQHVAYTAGTTAGGFNSPHEGPFRLEWFMAGDLDDEDEDGGPSEAFVEAALIGECDLADHHWMAAATTDPSRAEAALWSAAVAGYHLSEHKLIAPDELLGWSTIDGRAPDPVVLRAAARYAANHLQDFGRAVQRRADARALAAEVDPGDSGDPDRIGVVATGLARTDHRHLGTLVFGSLADGLAPDDLAQAVSLVTAARYALTIDQEGIDSFTAMQANAGIHAVRAGLSRLDTAQVQYELALASVESPSTMQLDPVDELYAPPTDDGALDDLVGAIEAGDPDGASEAGTAIRVEHAGDVDAAWSAIRAAAVADETRHLAAVRHVVGLEDDFRASTHPCRGWYLAAAARTAGRSAGTEQVIAARVREHLG